VAAGLDVAARPGDPGDVREDQAAPALAELAAAHELEALGDRLHRTFQLAPVAALGHAQVALDLARAAVEEEPELDDRLLTLGQLRQDLPQPRAVHARVDTLLRRQPALVLEDVVVPERDRAMAPRPLALVERLVQRRLDEIRADLLRVHRLEVEHAVALLLEQDGVGVMERRLAIRPVEPRRPASEHAEHVVAVRLVGVAVDRRECHGTQCLARRLSVQSRSVTYCCSSRDPVGGADVSQDP
jgi:hypothetical protein